MPSKVQQAARIAELMDRVRFPNYIFYVNLEGDRMVMQASFEAACNVSGGEVHLQKTRKWFISEHMTDSEVIQTMFKLVMTSEEHEIREKFLYRDKPIFGPHYDVDVLHAACTPEAMDTRS